MEGNRIAGGKVHADSKHPPTSSPARVNAVAGFMIPDLARIVGNYDAVPVAELPRLVGQQAALRRPAWAPALLAALAKSPESEIPPISVTVASGAVARSVHLWAAGITIEVRNGDVSRDGRPEGTTSVHVDFGSEAFDIDVRWTELASSISMFVKRNPELQEIAFNSLRDHCDRLQDRCADEIRRTLGTD